MGKDELSNRGIWQDKSGSKATIAEHGFFDVFKEHFRDSHYKIKKSPKGLKEIYVDVELSSKTLSEIYVPSQKVKNHGIKPDFAIKNRITKKILYIEIKRQDGWVEGGKRSDGRGNAHERSCKYFTPGLLKVLRAKGQIDSKYLPFWIVFQGDVTRDICRNKEVTLWFDDFQDHFFFWRDAKDPQSLIDHFENNLKQILD
ncbi:MAG: MunI family type II restriction endonuclease [Rhodobacteraceae bacterium]|nr:MunI family type II restriction endonuclease [Paracoccaceae bacterium]